MLSYPNVDGPVAELMMQTISVIKIQRMSLWVRMVWKDFIKADGFKEGLTNG